VRAATPRRCSVGQVFHELRWSGLSRQLGAVHKVGRQLGSHVGHHGLGRQGLRLVPAAPAADPCENGHVSAYPQGQQVADLGARVAPLLPVCMRTRRRSRWASSGTARQYSEMPK
jgi:hypothetical protein